MPVPILLVTGFLGAGKTTIVNHLLVSGQPVIIDGVMDVAARPGLPVRRPVATGF